MAASVAGEITGERPFLAVEIVPEQDRGPRSESGTIEIKFGNDTRFWVRGAVAPEMLRRVVDLLR